MSSLFVTEIEPRRGGRRGGRGRSRSGARGAVFARGRDGDANVKNTLNTKGKPYSISSRGHSHYNYVPPNRMMYKCRNCTSAASYPVYDARPPVYVADCRASASRYRDLVSGLALYNLARSSVFRDYVYHYMSYEMCSMQIKNKFTLEEIRVPCYMLSTFVNITTEANGMRQLNITSSDIVIGEQWLTVSGGALEVSPDMECVLWHNTSARHERRDVACDLLQKYADLLQEVERSTAPLWMFVFIGVGFFSLLIIGIIGSHFEDQQAKMLNKVETETELLNKNVML